MTTKQSIMLGLTAKMALTAVLATSMAAFASGRIFYRNTFDTAGDNVKLGGDSTVPTEFFQLRNGGDLENGMFDGGYTNIGDADASGVHARYIDVAGSDPNQHGIEPITGSFNTLVDQLNALGPGMYDLTLSLDHAASQHSQFGWWSVESQLLVQLKGTGAGGDGSWTMVSTDINGVDDTEFRHYSWTGYFDVTDEIMAPGDYAANQFLIGSFDSIYMRLSMDNRHTGERLTMNIDNLTFSSYAIPEPTSLALLGLGGLLLIRRRRAC